MSYISNLKTKQQFEKKNLNEGLKKAAPKKQLKEHEAIKVVSEYDSKVQQELEESAAAAEQELISNVAELSGERLTDTSREAMVKTLIDAKNKIKDKDILALANIIIISGQLAR